MLSRQSRGTAKEYSKVLGDAAAAPAFTSENSAAQACDILMFSKALARFLELNRIVKMRFPFAVHFLSLCRPRLRKSQE
eukprot:3847961-Amphidinium_carterae.1